MMADEEKVIALADRAGADERARRWIARIDAGSLTAAEREELRKWIASDPANAALLDRYAMLWSSAAKAKFPRRAPSTARGEYGDRSSLLKVRIAGALACAAAVAGIWLAVAQQREVAQQTFATAVGEHRSFALSDGSEVHLNTRSSTQIAYSAGTRRVVLDRGEGFFEVAKDKDRPFEVLAGDMIVRAVGTKFTVRLKNDGGVGVSVYEGVVQISRNSAADAASAGAAYEPIRLKAGQVAREQGSSILISGSDDALKSNEPAWLKGRLVFDSTPLAEVIDEVNRYSTQQIRLGDPSLQDLKVSGSVNTGDMSSLMKSLELGFGLKMKRDGETIVVVRRN